MKDLDVIRRKLGKMVEYLGELGPIPKVSFEVYNKNYFTRHTAERLIELIVEEAVDINGLIIVELGHPPPKDYYSSFLKMAEIGVLDGAFAKRVANTTGLRNRLAHEYEDVDNRIVWRGLKGFVRVYKNYIKAISSYIKE